jgi:MtrB/PioB family decaheme-associated outer membrane protein
MKNRTQIVFRRSAMATALLSAFGIAIADDAELAYFTKPESKISVGVGNWSSDREQQGQYDGMRDKGAYGLVDIDISTRNEADGTWLNVVGRNLGLDPRDISIDYVRQGDFGIGFDYSRITRDNPLNFNTGLQGKGSEVQNAAAITAGRGSNLELGITRDATGVRFYKNLMKGLEFNASFKNEEKNGERNWGRRSESTSVVGFITEPIDSTTRQFEARLDYSADKLQLGGGYYGSWYANHNDLVRATIGGAAATTTYMSLPLDNQAHQIFADGGYNFTPTTRGTFKVSYGQATQDESIPTRSIAGLSWAGAPSSLDGKLVTTRAQMGLTSRPIKELSLLANLRYDDLDDQTPEKIVTAAGTKVTPQSYRTIAGKLEGTYRLPYGYSVTAGLDHRDQKRSIPVGTYNASGFDTQRVVAMRNRVDETTYRIEGRKSMSDTVNGKLMFSRSDRDGSSYNVANGSAADARNYMNPFHVSDRVRDKWRFGLDWSPIERFSAQVAFDLANDDYSTKANRPYGIVDGSAQMFSLDLSYALTDDWSVTGWYSNDETKAKLWRGQTLSAMAATTYLSDLREHSDNVGLGVRGKISG